MIKSLPKLGEKPTPVSIVSDRPSGFREGKGRTCIAVTMMNVVLLRLSIMPSHKPFQACKQPAV